MLESLGDILFIYMKPFAMLILLSLTLIAAGCNPAESVNLLPTSEVPEITKESLADETNDGALILYWAEGCSHCESVKFKIANAKVDDKLRIVQKEAFNNDVVYREFFTRMKYCQVPEHQMGVPMLWDGERCYLGVEDIMETIGKRIADGG
jgi:thiol-disulfide isomerase/thioredoxin